MQKLCQEYVADQKNESMPLLAHDLIAEKINSRQWGLHPFVTTRNNLFIIVTCTIHDIFICMI